MLGDLTNILAVCIIHVMDRASPEARRAYSAVARAILEGELPPPYTLDCVSCHDTATLYHHPQGYSKRNVLNVVPMCGGCHYEAHRPPVDEMKLLVAYAKKVVSAQRRYEERKEQDYRNGVRKPRKLDQDKADEIRQLYSTGEYTQQQLADMVGVHFSAISLVVNNRRWPPIPKK